MNKEKIISFLNEQIYQSEFRANAYIYDSEDNARPQRDSYIKIKGHLDSFINGNDANRWVTLTGLRGAGKTTLLYQIFNDCKYLDAYRLFLSLDQTSQILNLQLDEVISVYEEIIGRPLEHLDKPLILFLDEVQYDPKWAIVIKSIFDRTNKVFIFATGSSALLMNINSDISRRSIFEKLFPLTYSEYLSIKYKKNENESLRNNLREAMFSSENAKEVFERITSLQSQINEYYLGVSSFEFEKYVNYGSLPFMIATANESIIYDQIAKTLDRVVIGDIANMGKFSNEILSRIPAILYSVADMDAFNFSTLSNAFAISRPTIMEIFEVLERTEVLTRVYPHGSHINQSKKASKYLFSSPAFRAMYYKMIGNTVSHENAHGKLFEDLVCMYLNSIFYKNVGKSITYDSAKGGADFILGFGLKKIIIEVGSSKKGYRQIVNTAKKVNAVYSLIISEEDFEFSEEFNCVKVPWRFFLLT